LNSEVGSDGIVLTYKARQGKEIRIMVLNFGMQENCMKASDHFREVKKMVELGSGAKKL